MPRTPTATIAEKRIKGGRPARGDDFRLTSVRGARRGLEEAIHAHRHGRITAASLTALGAAYRIWMELFIAEAELARLGLDVETVRADLDGGHVAGALADTPPTLTDRREIDDSGAETRVRTIHGIVVPGSFVTDEDA